MWNKAVVGRKSPTHGVSVLRNPSRVPTPNPNSGSVLIWKGLGFGLRDLAHPARASHQSPGPTTAFHLLTSRRSRCSCPRRAPVCVTLTAEIGMSGRAGRQKLRGRVVAGFARPAAMRLEGVAPFGPPAFILVARGENATLLLPRDEASSAARREARRYSRRADGRLPGPRRPAGDPHWLRRPGAAGDRRASAWQWMGVDRSVRGHQAVSRAGMFGRWRGVLAIACGHARGLADRVSIVDRQLPAIGPPSVYRAECRCVDLTATLSQIETNNALEDAAFTVNVLPGAEPITLDELRDVGPLGS